ncbi:DUF4132 domain-containing protein [Methylobacterium sp. P1-11]|uniref:DUF4132 domain-containing protein n=1 Tax=Methylobacterium sp. P1-11 TaxID=2024616 RepID=UPI0011ED2C9E|nr:DUF4132 domain-containing protein [Methylobacterium sp. P1-11]KAA0123369.1 DUF4132 domain-containing protein [Methylobacterium sp. P1-11]
MERYELVEGSAAKFWEVGVSGPTLTVRFGRLGTQGQSKDKTCADAAAAVKEKDKLVREKTAKGYVRADGAAPAPATASVAARKPDAAQASRPVGETVAETVVETAAERAAEPAVEPAAAPPQAEAPAVPAEPVPPPAPAAIFEAVPLPTRLRPGPRPDATEAWQAIAAPLAAALGDAEAARLAGTPPDRDGLAAWLDAVVDAAEARRQGNPSRAATGDAVLRRALEAILRYAVAQGGTAAVARLADRRRPTPKTPRAYQRLSWAEPLHLALRAALVHAPEADYDAAVAFLNARIAEDHDWPAACGFAFILADDRPSPHPLQPVAVLEAAASAGIDVTADTVFLPLLADAPPEAVAAWRAKRSYHLYFVYCAVDAAEAAATLLAVARAAGQPALPSLDWLLHYALDEQRRTVALAILSTGEAGALPALLPHLHEKPVAAALDAALEDDPAAILPRCLAALAGGRSEPALRARVNRALDVHGLDLVRGWLAASGGRGAGILDALAEARAVPLAEPAAWPRVLRDPPWRTKGRTRDDLVLALAPLPTPFAHAVPEVAPSYWRERNAVTLDGLEALSAFVAAAELAHPTQGWSRIPPPLSEPPRDDLPALIDWVATRVAQIDGTCHYWANSPYHKLVGSLERQPEPLALALWAQSRVVAGCFHVSQWPEIVWATLSRFGERAMPGLVDLVETDPVGLLPAVLVVDDARLAVPAARALTKLKKAREPALAWLRRHPETALTRLLPDAVGRPGSLRDAAEHALRVLAQDRADGRAIIVSVAARYADQAPEVTEAVAQVLDRDPLARVPAKVGKPPVWLVPAMLTRPRLRDGTALPDAAILTLCEMLSFTNPDAVYAGVPMVREACTEASLAAFAWDLFSAWIAAGTPSKDGWALRALGWFGTDATARDLTRLIRRWPGEAAHARAVTGLDVLVDIGTDVALMNLNGIAEKLKFKGLQEKARQKIAQLAEARGLTPEELADRLAPDLDLDERGGLDLDFGPRGFRVGFDETLKPWVRDAAGQRLKDLPKPAKADDAGKAAAAVARWGALKKDARAVASLQVARLEAMLAGARRVQPTLFGPCFAAHPLVRHLAQRLVWATFADADPRTGPGLTFRVAEDLTFTDADDAPLDLDLTGAAPGLIGLVHPLQLDAGALAAWGVLFGDYEIVQPFPQLGRETYAFTEAEAAAATTDRFAGTVVEANRLRGMAARGWPLGAPQDGGVVWWIERAVTFPGGATGQASLTFSEGLFTGAVEFEDREQTLGELTLGSPWSNRTDPGQRTFGALAPVTASELLRGPSLLAGTRLR